jgi:hypothetical protein
MAAYFNYRRNGPNTVFNIEPMPKDDHIKMHSERGDFKRWGALRGKAAKTCKKAAKAIPIVGTVVTIYFAAETLEAKGLEAGSADIALHAIPLVGLAAGVAEIITGKEFMAPNFNYARDPDPNRSVFDKR